MFTCTRIFEFDAAHRIIGHPGLCKMLHGHRYKAEITFGAEKLDKLGMVIDFQTVKNKVNDWLFKNWDHNTILSKSDKKLGDFIEEYTGQKVFYLDDNPTAENMANHLLFKVCTKIFNSERVFCKKIRLYETPNCFTVVKAF